MVFIIAFLLAPYAVMAIIGVLAATHANVAFWLAEHGIHTDTCPSPEVVARQKADADAKAAAANRKFWAELFRERVVCSEERLRQAIGYSARDEAERNLCWELANEQFHLDGWAGKITLKGESHANEIDRRCEALLAQRYAIASASTKNMLPYADRPEPVYQKKLHDQFIRDYDNYDKISYAFCSDVDGHREYGIRLYMEKTGAGLEEAQDMLEKVKAEVKLTGRIGFA